MDYYPMDYYPYCPMKSKDAITAIADAEAEIAKCMADFICSILDKIKCDHKLSEEKKIQLFRCLILASAVKEKAMAAVIKALAKLTLAQKK